MIRTAASLRAKIGRLERELAELLAAEAEDETRSRYVEAYVESALARSRRRSRREKSPCPQWKEMTEAMQRLILERVARRQLELSLNSSAFDAYVQATLPAVLRQLKKG